MQYCHRRGRDFLRLCNDQHGVVLVIALIVMMVLTGLGTVALVGGYTNLLSSTNLRLAASARATAETNVNEALFRLTLQPSQAAAIVPNIQDPDWNVAVEFTSGDTNSSDYDVSTIQNAADWPAAEFRPAAAVTLEFKKDADGNVIFYNRAVPAPNPPYLKFQLPMDELGAILPLVNTLSFLSPVVTLLEDTVYQLLCDEAIGLLGGLGGPVEEVGEIVGDLLGVCPASLDLPDAGYPVIQMRTTGLDARGARREFLAEAVRTVMFTPVAPLSAGGNVNLNSVGFIDGINHHHGILLGSEDIYGDISSETTNGSSGLLDLLLGTIKDSPDDSNLWTPTCPLLCLGQLTQHSVANLSLLVDLALPAYTSFPRMFNKQISSTNQTSAWVGLQRLPAAVTELTANLLGLGVPLPPLIGSLIDIGIWTEFNLGYTAAIALAATPTITNWPIPSSNVDAVWSQGIFSWRVNNINIATNNFLGSVNLADEIPAANTVTHCGPAVIGNRPPLVCRPQILATFPDFQTYIGLDDVTYQELLDTADTDSSAMSAGSPPVGFTYLAGDYSWSTGTNPSTNNFGLLYASGNLSISSNDTRTFKGLIFVDGNLTISGSSNLLVLGAVMVRGNVTHTGGGRMTVLYSREAANRGLQAARPWRLITWAETALQDVSGN